MLSLWVLSALLIACGSGDDSRQPTRVPTRIPPTPTLRSTALPEVAEAPDIGAPERPITILFALPDDRRTTAVRQTARQLGEQLSAELGLSFAVEITDETSALGALCSGAPTLAWVSAFTYAAAYQECSATPQLAVKRGRMPTFYVGQSAEVVGRRVITDLSQLAGQTFCRSGGQEEGVAWVLPALLLGSASVHPFMDLKAVRDYPDDPSVVLALYRGECDAAAFRPGDFDQAVLDAASMKSDTEEEQPDAARLKAALHVIVAASDTTAPTTTTGWRGISAGILPYEVLVAAPQSALPPDLRQTVVDQIGSFFNDRAEGTARTRRLLDADGILPVTAQHYRPFVSMLERAGWQMAFFP